MHIKNDGKYIDATLGYAGHSLAILKKGGLVLGIEADKKMLNLSQKRIEDEGFGTRFTCELGNFRDIENFARIHGFFPADGIIFDLGISSVHLDDDHRGFSFKNETDVLDMRLSGDSQGVMAKDLLNSLSVGQLRELFMVGMAFKEANKLALEVVRIRQLKKFEIVADLLKITGNKKRGGLNEATKAFMALRIAVNSEYHNLREGLTAAKSIVSRNGTVVVISFHSGEDRIAKEVLERSILVVPSETEIDKNPRARSAKMRIYKNV